jgi:mannosyl-3-phosphoglycerate phosphatase
VLVKVFGELKKKFAVQSFADMNDEEVAQDTHLDKTQAVLAKQREFDLPFRIFNENERDDVVREIKKHNLKYTVGGRYYHLLGDNDKGQAVRIVTDLYRQKYGSVYTIGIGDSENDYAMLDVVDCPYLVKQKDGRFASRNYSLADGVGPDGWRKAIESEFNI